MPEGNDERMLRSLLITRGEAWVLDRVQRHRLLEPVLTRSTMNPRVAELLAVRLPVSELLDRAGSDG